MKDCEYSVVIPSCNRVGMLRDALESLLAQPLVPYEVILVIDESVDTEKYAFLATFALPLRVQFTGGGLGGARARNLGLDQVSAPHVFFLDDDDIWFPTKAELQVQALRDHPE